MRAPAAMPVRQYGALLRCRFERGTEPAVEQRLLHGRVLRSDPPVALGGQHAIAADGECFLGRLHGGWAERRAEALVEPLMAVEQLEQERVLGLVRCALRAAVVGQRETDGGARRRAARRERLD